MTTNKYPRGSEWRKWDLHIHTPKSICNNYGGDTDSVWDKYIEALERLPQEVSVIGINDYYFIDGYEKVMQYRKKDRLKNIDKIFPVLEFRIDTFGSGNENKLQKINLHILFDLNEEDLDNEIKKVREEFIGMIPLTSLERHKTKKLSIENLISEGGTLQDGFANLIPSTKTVFDIINSETWRNKVFLFLGYKEWSNLEKNQQLKPFKEDLYSKVNAFFTSNYASLGKSQEWLDEFGEKRLLHSLDIHDFSILDTANKDVNNEFLISSSYFCNTWIKADPTFEGLKQIDVEYNNRVFIGENPILFKTINDNRTKYIEDLYIDCVDGYTGTKGKWFENIRIPFNNELVAIIGNKGNGKSAISDILSHCCNYKSQEYFSFLNDDKFRNKNLASNFVATVTFKDGQAFKKGLSDKLEGSEVTRVKYLPQGYFESICNDLQKEENLKSEIEAVVFQYIEESSRLGTANFKELIAKKSNALELDIQQLKSKLSLINKEIIALEDKDYPSYKNSIDASIEQKEKEIAALIVPQEVPKPSSDDEQSKDTISKIEKLKEEIVVLNDTIQKLKDEKSSISITLAKINNFIINVNRLVQNIEDFKQENKSFVESLGGDIDGIITVNKDLSLLESKKSEFESRLNAIEKLIVIDSQYEDSPAYIIKKKQDEINELREKLDGPSKAYQAYLQRKEEYEKSKKRIEGDEATPNTLVWLKKEKEYIDGSLSVDLQEKENERNQCLKEIYNKRKEIISIYQQVKSKLDAKISENNLLLKNYEIKIGASLGLGNSFPEDFLRYVNQSRVGSFRGKDSGLTLVQELIKESDIQDENGIEAFCNSFIDKLKNEGGKKVYIKDQVENRQSLYDYLFSLDYLTNNYSIMQGDKDLSVLSPGEKGALLLVFYLLLDMDNTPLILDQPEDNLDNDSVANILVDFIKEAKKKRQIIMVTHNPNLAVVADAEQIIYVRIDKKDGNKVFVESGSIENPQINAHIVDVLEGAMPAFRKRDDKYIQQQ